MTAYTERVLSVVWRDIEIFRATPTYRDIRALMDGQYALPPAQVEVLVDAMLDVPIVGVETLYHQVADATRNDGYNVIELAFSGASALLLPPATIAVPVQATTTARATALLKARICLMVGDVITAEVRDDDRLRLTVEGASHVVLAARGYAHPAAARAWALTDMTHEAISTATPDIARLAGTVLSALRHQHPPLVVAHTWLRPGDNV